MQSLPTEKDLRQNLAFLQRWPLVRQIIIVIGVVIILLGVATNELIKRIETPYLINILKEQGQHTSSLLASASLETTIQEDLPSLQTLLEQVGKSNADIVKLTIFGASNEQLASWDNPIDTTQGKTLSWDSNIELDGNTFGRVRVMMRTDRLHAKI